ncbi:MAG TPA: HAMP domain-containing sensor histidine kinase [Verrucomicrobiae bacterium]|jgi:signal transduction histidine kinase
MNPDPKPKFFWQGVMILLPVALMAGFGFWAILRQHNDVEQDARQRANEIVQALPKEFGRLVANELIQFDGQKGGWFMYLQWGPAGWPGDRKFNGYLTDTNTLIDVSNDVAALKSAFPDWKDGPPPLVDFTLEPNGDLGGSPPIPPRPPSWLTAMSPRQYQAWTALETADYASESLSNLVALTRAFEQTGPQPPARSCAEFIHLRAESRTQPATNAIGELIRFAGGHDDVESESGLPLTTLALAESLKRARECGPTAQLWEALRSEILQPSALTPSLLDEAARLVVNNAQLSDSIRALRILLADKQSQQELAGAVRRTGKLNGITTTNLWVAAMNRRWFCILQPDYYQNWNGPSNRFYSAVHTNISVRCYPESIVARGFSDAFKDAEISLPNYFGISISLEDRPISLRPEWKNIHDEKPDILAEEQFNMSATGVWTRTSGQESFEASYKAMPDSRSDGPKIFFEMMPGHPQFTIRILLTNRNLLFAKQRQLQLVFGSLIALAALAALVGFVAARRAFHRQLQLNEMKSNFVSSVSHELRAPIASVRLMAENLERGKIPEAQKQNDYFRFIVQECRRLSSLIENVLDFSRIERGRKQYEFEATNLSALTQTTVKLMESYAAEKGVQLKTAFNPQPSDAGLELNVDGRAIQQALVNLIDNAIKHSPKGASVQIGLEAKFDLIQLWVEDQGQGIPAKEHEKIFERFYRSGSELRRETQGVGIGLSIVKHIVESHGGRVRVQSEPGQGSRFTIELPARNPHE